MSHNASWRPNTEAVAADPPGPALPGATAKRVSGDVVHREQPGSRGNDVSGAWLLADTLCYNDIRAAGSSTSLAMTPAGGRGGKVTHTRTGSGGVWRGGRLVTPVS